MRSWLTTGAVTAVACAAAVAGCGNGSDHSSRATPPSTAAPPATTDRTTTAPRPARPRGAAHRSHGVAIEVPRGLGVSPKASSGPGWPRPRLVVSSFPVVRTSANVLCPRSVLASIPPNGVYIVVAEYTNPPPPGIPARTRPGPRGDLSRLDIRPSEVECWEGPSGQTSFREHGRDFHVELLLGKHVSASERRRALETLGSLRVSG